MVLVVPSSFDDLDADWFTAALNEQAAAADIEVTVGSILVEPFDASTGLIGDLARVHLDFAEGTGPPSVVVKLPARDPSSRRIGEMLNAYAREVAFYVDAAPSMTEVALPQCFYAAGDPAARSWVLVLEDLPAEAIDPDAGVSLSQAEAVVDALAALHGQWWEAEHRFDWMPGFDSSGVGGLQEPWLQAIPVFLERYSSLIPAETDRWVREFAPQLAAWSAKAAQEPLTIVHTDCRTDNLIFCDGAVTVIDWQTALRGPAAMDLSCFLATSLTIENRRMHEAMLIERYINGLAAQGIDVDPVWFAASYDENLLWWMGQFGNNLAHLDPGDPLVQRSLDTMVERTYTAALDRDVGRLLG